MEQLQPETQPETQPEIQPEIQPETNEIITPTEEEPKEKQPIKDVATFWERLDEVLDLVKTGGTIQNKQLDEILEQFPDFEKTKVDAFKSFIFQPERISLSSNDDQTFLTARSNSLYTSGHAFAERFSSFRINFRKALRNVKSIQLLSAVIPNATQNIPDEAVCFFYYKIRTTEQAFNGYNPATNYLPGDLAGLGANNYACRIPNTGINPSIVYWIEVENYWELISLPVNNPWNISTTYFPGALVSYLGNSYRCITASQGIEPYPTTTWNSTTAYVITDYVYYNNKVYYCLTANTGIIPGETYWININLPINPNLPNYYDLNPYHIYVVYLYPTFGNLPESQPAANENGFNRTFQDYNDLVGALNYCVTNNGLLGNTNATIPNDIQFVYNATLNKIQMIPNNDEIIAGNYYMPCGYGDPNIQQFMNLPTTQTFFGVNYPGVFLPETTLNLRLGYTWNGIFPDPFQSPDILTDVQFSNTLLWYLRPKSVAYPVPWNEDILTFNSYPDLVNTASVRIYADVVLGSTEDSSNEGGLLSVIPVNASNLGIGFYQNNFNNPLTKIPRNIMEIQIRMLTDNGLPYNLPNSATVLLELAIDYY